MSKSRSLKSIDLPSAVTGGSTVLELTENAAPPARPTIGVPPRDLTLTTIPFRSAVTATAAIDATWRPPDGIEPQGYDIEIGTGDTFIGAKRVRTTVAAHREEVRTNTTFYVRVRAIVGTIVSPWSATESILSAQDTAPPTPPTGLTAAFLNDGSLEVRCTNPPSSNLQAIEVKLYNNSGKSILYESDEFTAGVWRWSASRNRDQLSGTPTATVFVELRARSWSGVLSTSVSVSATKPRPANVSGATATWDGATGTCSFRWNSASGAVRYDLTIDGVTRRIADTRFEYALPINRQDHSGTADPVLTWSIIAIDALDQTSVTPATGTATLAPPATPSGVTHTWSGDTGLAAADWSIDCTPIGGVVGRRLSIDSISRDLPIIGRYSYPLTLNAQEHGGTADPVLSYSLVWVDALGQASTTPASGTATNAAPPAPSATTVQAFFSAISLSTTATPLPADFATFRYRLIQTDPSAADVIFNDLAALITRTVETAASYQIGVRVVDLFGQQSSETLSAVVVADALTLADLRAAAAYRDSISTSPATLKAQLADGVRTSGGVTYSATSSWRWIEVQRELTDRYQPILITATAGQGYVSVSLDGVTWSFYSGPLDSDGVTLTAVASEAAAQSAALNLPTASTGRWDLPILVEARFVRLHHRNVGASYTIREYYAERVVEGDLIRAGSVKALAIAGKSITGDQIAGLVLSAIFASLGEVTIDPNGFLRSGQTAYNNGTGFWIGHVSGTPRMSLGVAGGQGFTWNGSAFSVSGAFNLSGIATIGASGGLYQGTGSFASPTTGLKIWNQSGIGRLATYGSGVVQVEFDSTGKFQAAGGKVEIDATGMGIEGQNGTTITDPGSKLKFWAPGTRTERMYLSYGSGALLDYGELFLSAGSNKNGEIAIAARSTTATRPGLVSITGENTAAGSASLTLSSFDLGSSASVRIDGTIEFSITPGLSRSRSDFQVDGRPRAGLGSTSFWTDFWRVGNNNPFSGDTNMLEIVPHSWGDGLTLLFNAYSVDQVGGIRAPGNVKRSHAYGGGTTYATPAMLSYDGNGRVFSFLIDETASGARGTNAVWPASIFSLGVTGSVMGSTAVIANQRLRLISHLDTSTAFPLAVIQTNNSTSLMYIRGDGQAWVNQAWTIGSDAALKRDITPFDDDPLALIGALNVRKYRRRNRMNSPEEIGVIAQELEQAGGRLAELVSVCGSSPDEDMRGVDYTGLTMIAIAAIQRIADRIAKLEARVTARL